MALNMEGEERIEAPIQKVWEALNDPVVLKECIPGCQSLEKTSDKELAATVVLKIGPIKATFNGEVTLSNLKPLNGYTISGRRQGRHRRLRQRRGRRDAGRGRTEHDDPEIHCKGRCRRQDRPARQPPDRIDLEEAGGTVLLNVQPDGERGLTASIASIPRRKPVPTSWICSTRRRSPEPNPRIWHAPRQCAAQTLVAMSR